MSVMVKEMDTLYIYLYTTYIQYYTVYKFHQFKGLVRVYSTLKDSKGILHCAYSMRKKLVLLLHLITCLQ